MIVLDASVLVNAVGDDGPAGAQARAELAAAADIVLPDLADIETAHVLRRWWLQGALTEQRFRQAVRDLSTFPFQRFPAQPLLDRAFELRSTITVYDAMYVALAEEMDCPLVTADRSLALAPGPRCAFRVVVADG